MSSASSLAALSHGMDFGIRNHTTPRTLNLRITIDGESPESCCKLKHWTMHINVYTEYNGAEPVWGSEKFKYTVKARP